MSLVIHRAVLYERGEAAVLGGKPSSELIEVAWS
jgi:hypothetical protein